MIKVTGTLDIECADWTKFVCAATYEPASGRKIHRTPESLVDHVCSRGGTWWAHCGGIYDSLLVADVFERRGTLAQIDYVRARINRIVGGGATIRDSYALIPMSLDVAATIAGEKAPTLPWSCMCGRDCGGYCKIVRRASGGDPDVEDYCAADAYVLFRVLAALQEHAEQWGIDLRGTIGSTAWANAQRLLELPDCKLPWQTWDRIAEGDFGGRDFVGMPRALWGKRQLGSHHDISSAYPAALATTPLPVGDPAELGERDARLALHADSPGIYR